MFDCFIVLYNHSGFTSSVCFWLFLYVSMPCTITYAFVMFNKYYLLTYIVAKRQQCPYDVRLYRKNYSTCSIRHCCWCGGALALYIVTWSCHVTTYHCGAAWSTGRQWRIWNNCPPFTKTWLLGQRPAIGQHLRYRREHFRRVQTSCHWTHSERRISTTEANCPVSSVAVRFLLRLCHCRVDHCDWMSEYITVAAVVQIRHIEKKPALTRVQRPTVLVTREWPWPLTVWPQNKRVSTFQ